MLNQKQKILDSEQFEDGTKIEIVEYESLDGCKNVFEAEKMFFVKEAGLRMKMIKITLNNSKCKTESGALYFSKGRISNNVPIGGIGGTIKKAFKSSLTQEKMFNPEYTGNGELFLEPTFSHYIMMKLNGEALIVDKGIYVCSVGNIEVNPVIQKNFSSAIAGGEGLFQTKIEGFGIVVLESPCPLDEIMTYELKNEKLQVDGNFVFARESNINFTVEKSAKGLLGSFVGGEGLLQTFEGTGKVLLAPTAPVYKNLKSIGVENIQQGNMNNKQ